MDLPGIPLLLPGDGKAGHCGFVTRGGPLCLRRVYDRPEERLRGGPRRSAWGRPRVARVRPAVRVRFRYRLGLGLGLRDLCESDLPFGGVTSIGVGDFYHLPFICRNWGHVSPPAGTLGAPSPLWRHVSV